MSYLGDVIRHAGEVPVFVAYLHPPMRLHGRWWRRWYAYAPRVQDVPPAFGVTRGQAERRLRGRLVDRYLHGPS